LTPNRKNGFVPYSGEWFVARRLSAPPGRQAPGKWIARLSKSLPVSYFGRLAPVKTTAGGKIQLIRLYLLLTDLPTYAEMRNNGRIL
jgi:hypothetical protein